MTRLVAITSFVALVAAGSVAIADRYATAGTRGTVTAYELDGSTVISHKVCLRTGYTWDYSRCHDRLRDSVKYLLCGRLGSGTHPYYYQVGDSKPLRTSIYCSRR